VEQRPLGRTGLTVSALGFGCGSVGGLMVRGDPFEQRRAVAHALNAGVTYFDTAPGYGDGRSEENLGRTLRELDAWDRVVVGTKVRLTPEDRADPPRAIGRSLERSLRLLGRDRIDLLQLHNQLSEGGEGGGLPEEELLGPVAVALQQAVATGLVRHVGITGLGDAAVVRRAVRSGRFATVQAYFNAINPSAGFAGVAGGGHDFGGFIDDAGTAGVGVIAIRVLAAGALSGSEERAPNASPIGGAALIPGAGFQEDVTRARRLAAVATELGLDSPIELGLRFALTKPGISTALVGVSDLGQLEQAVRWAERGPLPPDTVRRIVGAAD
jgi:L-galactose dehydrogenase/L-glyceraldehyde 3-phosphate reductase